jgi:hypothetical protein
VDELHDAVGWWTRADDEPWAGSGSVDLVLGAAEAHAWISDSRPYENRFHRQPWESAIADLHAAADRCGPQVHAVLGADLSDAITATRPPAAALAALRTAADAALIRLRKRLQDPAVAVAAWRDLVDACTDTTTTSDVVAFRRDLFRSLLRAAGASARSIGQLLAGILHDSAAFVAEAKDQLGEISPDADRPWPRQDTPAGLSETERLALCERMLQAPPRAADHVVWLAFAKARIGASTLKMGPVTFYPVHVVQGIIGQAASSSNLLPTELVNPDSWLDAQ